MNPLEKYISILDDAIDYISTGFRSRRNNRSIIGSDLAIERMDVISRRSIKISETQEKSDSARLIEEINREISKCVKCPLHQSRSNPVPGKGNPDADIVFIGEGPGEMEDKKGEPFVGRAGQLLTKMLGAIQLRRDEVYITNIVKCRPPGNRTPAREEVNACFPYLERQLEIIKPLIICCLGGPAIKALIKTDMGITKLRGKIHYYKDIPVIPTYHPAAVLRFPDRYRREVWNDLKLLKKFYMEIKK